MIRDTLVRTPSGAKSIVELGVGDLVCNEFGNPVRVKRVISRGREPVVDLLVNGKLWASCSREHRWLVKECCGPKQAIYELKKVSDFISSDRLVLEGHPFGIGVSVAISSDYREDEIFDFDVESGTSLYLLENGLVAHS
jgi:hypothetical protein